MGTRRFRDREDAGRQLAALLMDVAKERPLVLALPRGGVPVAFEVARGLDAQLDVWVVKKLGVPWQPEFGYGAVAEGGHTYVNRDIVERVGITPAELTEAIARKREEVAANVRRYRGELPRPGVRGRTVVLVDDGIATGGTMAACVEALRAEGATRLIIAAPVGSPQTLDALRPGVDRLVCPLAPDDLQAIGQWYDDFTQVPDAEVARLLDEARSWNPPRPSPGAWPREDHRHAH